MNPTRRPLLIVFALAVAAIVAAVVVIAAPDRLTAATSLAGLAGLAAAVVGLRDAALKATVQLPTGAASAYTAGLDLCNDTPDADPRGLELEVVAPALTTAKLPDTKTLTYDLQHDDAVGFGTVATLAAAVIVQTGAGGTGAAGQTIRFAVPSTCKRYVRLKVTGVATVAPAVGDLAELQALV